MNAQLYHCEWNWCRDTFTDDRSLQQHLKSEHLNSIITVKKEEWDIYLRSTEGTSGATDSLLATNSLSTFSQSFAQNSPKAVPARNSLPRKRPSPTPSETSLSSPASPPRKKRRTPTPLQPPSPSPPGFPSTPVVKNVQQQGGFASYAAQSSPMRTPSVASIPPSPALSNMVADAINTAAQLNGSLRVASNGDRAKPVKRPSPLPLPRRVPPGAPQRQIHSQRQSLESSASAQDVEIQLTQNLDISPSGSQPQSQESQSQESQLQESQLQESQSQPQPHPELPHTQFTEELLMLRTQAAYASQCSVHAEIHDFLLSSQGQGAPVFVPSFRSGTLRVEEVARREAKAEPAPAPAREDDDDKHLYAGPCAGVGTQKSQAQTQRSQDRATSSDPGGSQLDGYGHSSMPLYAQAPYRSQSPSQ